MSDPLAHVGPSPCYLRGYNDGVGGRAYLTPYPVMSIETAEYEEGFFDGQADVAAGLVLGQSKAADLIPW